MNATGNYGGRPGGLQQHVQRGSAPQSWFLGAPVSKFFATMVAALYIAAEMGNFHGLLSLDLNPVFNDGEIWRLLTCHLTFSSVGELVFGLLLLCPLMKRFEREMGSRKFGTFALFSLIISTSWELLISQVLFSSTGEDGHALVRATGPYSLLGSLLYLYRKYTPRLHPHFVGLLGMDFSEKALTYFLAMQLMCAQGLLTILPAFCGFISGYICTTKALRIAHWELPDFFYRLCGLVGAPFVESTPVPPVVAMRGVAPGLRQRNTQNQETRPLIASPEGGPVAFGNRQAPFAQPQFQNLPPPPPPPEEVVDNLVSMGFEREAVIRVLQECDNNPEVAANRLLSD